MLCACILISPSDKRTLNANNRTNCFSSFSTLKSIRWCTCLSYIVAMAKVLNIFQSTIKYYQTLGIYPSQSNQNYSINIKSIFILSSMIGLFCSTSTFFLFNAENIVEFSDAFKAFYISSSVISFMTCFLVNIFNIRDILEFIKKYEKFLQKSEFMKLIKQAQTCAYTCPI